MLFELLQNYVDIINGATRMTKRKANQTARALLHQAGLDPAAEMVSKLTEDILAASKAQRQNVEEMVTAEVDRVVKRVGFVRKEEFDSVKQELADLRRSMGNTATKRAATKASPSTQKAAAKKSATKKAAARKPAPGSASPAKKAAASRAARKTTKKAPVKSDLKPVDSGDEKKDE